MAYRNMQFIAYVIDTAPIKNLSGVSTYLGLPDAAQDIDARCSLLMRAIETASVNLTHSSPPETAGDTLKVFMAPEFYFRGNTGAYQMDEVQVALTQLQKMVAGAEWSDWLFVFGSIVGVSSPTLDTPPYDIDPDAEKEIYNFSLLQQGGPANPGNLGAKVVMKEMMSSIDFVKGALNSGGLRAADVDHLKAGPAAPGRERQQVNYDGAGVFDLNGVTWGVEICLDHLAGRLQSSPQLPGDKQIQVQLVPSCGMSIQPGQVSAEQQGYVFNCDGLGNGSSVLQVGAAGAPPLTALALTPVAKQGSVAVSGAALESAQSPPQAIGIDRLYRNGAGVIDLYGPVEVPPVKAVPGSITSLNWQVSEDYRFDFDLVYDAAGWYTTTLCQISSAKTNFNGLKYFLPLVFSTTDSSGAGVSINMKNGSGSYGYDQAVWCKINLPGFIFEGNAFEFYSKAGSSGPRTCW